MFKRYQPGFNKKFTSSTGRGNFRVRGPIKSFRDLEVYRKSTELAADVFVLEVAGETNWQEEMGFLREITKQIPKLIAESYGNRFTEFVVAERKLEKTAEVVSVVLAKIDFLLVLVAKKKEALLTEAMETGSPVTEEDKTSWEEFEKELHRLLREYSVNRVKILNLKKSWVRLNEKINQEQQSKKEK